MSWVEYATSDLIENGVLEIGDGYRAKNSEMAEQGIPFVRAGDVDGRVNTVGTDRLSVSSVEKVGRKRAMAGDVVMTTKGTIGRLAFVKEGDPEFIYSPQLCFWRSLKKEVIDSRWLFYAMRSPGMMNQISWSAGQTDMAPYVSLTDQRTAFKLTLLPIEEQREIAAVLGALDDKIEVNRKTAATLEAMARALYRSWFVDFDPVHAKAAGRAPAHMDAATAALFPDRFGEDGLPEGWEMVSVYEVARVQYGAPFKSKLFNTDNEGRPLVRIRDLKNNKAGVFTTEVHKKEYLIQPGDTVVGMDGDFTPNTWCAEPSLMNQRVCAFLPLEKHNKAFVRYAVPALLKAEEDAAVATTVIHLGKKDIETFEVIRPCEEMKRAFGERVNPMLEKLVSIGLENQTLATLRDMLLPRLMSGELRVGVAREQVEAAV